MKGEEAFNRGVKLRDEKRYEEAVAAFDAVIAESQASLSLIVHSHLQAAQILKDVCRYTAAEDHARKAVELAPDKELASLMLYHVLIALAERREALLEIIRFVSRRDSPMYRDLLSEGYDLSNLGLEYEALLEKARCELARWPGPKP